MKESLISFSPKINFGNTHILPFYPPMDGDDIRDFIREKHSFIYVSNGNPHKCHLRLLEAFLKFYIKYKVGRLYLTISEDYPIILEKINELVVQGIPIVNLGIVHRNNLREIYKSCEFTIYPSMTESFGLGLIEALENGCNIIGADLPYTYAVCRPSIIFDPTNEDSIVEALEKSLQENIVPSEQLVFNEIDNLIDLLK